MPSKRLFFAIVFFLAAAFVWFFWFRVQSPGGRGEARNGRETPATSRPIATPDLNAEDSRLDDRGKGPASSSLDEMRQTVAENMVPGRMVFLDFALSAEGLRWIGATGAAGRAKAEVPQTGLGFVRYEVFDRAGRIAAAGSVVDPMHRRIEHPAEGNEGKIAIAVFHAPAGVVAVRVPGESDAARIVFFRESDSQAGLERRGEIEREIVGTVLLRPGT